MSSGSLAPHRCPCTGHQCLRLLPSKEKEEGQNDTFPSISLKRLPLLISRFAPRQPCLAPGQTLASLGDTSLGGASLGHALLSSWISHTQIQTHRREMNFIPRKSSPVTTKLQTRFKYLPALGQPSVLVWALLYPPCLRGGGEQGEQGLMGARIPARVARVVGPLSRGTRTSW